eukprot:11187546-Lingulodinium_polyedra.AAC.1
MRWQRGAGAYLRMRQKCRPAVLDNSSHCRASVGVCSALLRRSAPASCSARRARCRRSASESVAPLDRRSGSQPAF